MPCAPASSQAMFRPLVITVTSRCERRWRASIMVVEPESRMMLSPGFTSTAATRPSTVARAAGAKVITITNSIASTLARNSDVVLCAPAKEAPLMGQNAAARIAQLAILDTMFICLAREDYETAERNLNKVLTSVAVYSTNDRGRTERRGTPRADKSSPDGVQPAKETAR